MDKIEAIRILKDFHDESAIFSVRTALETLHPELKESEDEKIRKELIEFVKSRGGFKQEYIAWLEKQGEQDEWTQDDEQYLLICRNALYKYQVSDKWDANIIYGWLKRRIKGK